MFCEFISTGFPSYILCRTAFYFPVYPEDYANNQQYPKENKNYFFLFRQPLLPVWLFFFVLFLLLLLFLTYLVSSRRTEFCCFFDFFSTIFTIHYFLYSLYFFKYLYLAAHTTYFSVSRILLWRSVLLIPRIRLLSLLR